MIQVLPCTHIKHKNLNNQTLDDREKVELNYTSIEQSVQEIRDAQFGFGSS